MAILVGLAEAHLPAELARTPVRPAVLTAMVTVPLLVAGVALSSSDDPASWNTSSGGGEVGDVITAVEALISVANVAGAFLVSWLLGRRPAERVSRST